MLAVYCPAARAEVQTQPDLLKVAAAHYATGESFFRAGQFEQAIVEFEAAYKHSREPDLIYNLCLAYRRLGEQAGRQSPEVDLQRSQQYCEQFCLVRVTDPTCAQQKPQPTETPGRATTTKPNRAGLLALAIVGGAFAISGLSSGIAAGVSARQYNEASGMSYLLVGQPLRDRYQQSSVASGVLSASALLLLSIDLAIWQRQKRQTKNP